jgi:predicted nicotinamide N-methyase
MPIWRLTEAERGERGVPPPFWAFAWLGGLAIARYLLDHPDEVADKHVLDFATGSGLCAIAAMKAGATWVLAADVDRYSHAAVALNVAANGVRVAFTRRDLLDADPPDVDVILAGDIFYEASVAARVLAWLQMAHSRGTRILLGDPGRTYFPGHGLVRLADYQIQTTRELEDAEIKRAGVFTFE